MSFKLTHIIFMLCCFLLVGYFVYNASHPIIEYELFYDSVTGAGMHSTTEHESSDLKNLF